MQCFAPTNPEIVHHTFQENSIASFKVQREGTTEKKNKKSLKKGGKKKVLVKETVTVCAYNLNCMNFGFYKPYLMKWKHEVCVKCDKIWVWYKSHPSEVHRRLWKEKNAHISFIYVCMCNCLCINKKLEKQKCRSFFPLSFFSHPYCT